MSIRPDHDFHIHSMLSSCSSDPEQTAEAILAYGRKNGFRHLCLTDHYWDEKVPSPSDWYAPQDTAHVQSNLPLPRCEGVQFHFGVETEMDKYFRLGISPERINEFDFVIIPTTHLHMRDFTIDEKDWDSVERRTELYAERFRTLLQMPLPFHKIGIAHITCPLISGSKTGPLNYLDIVSGVDGHFFGEIFERAAKVGVGIELNHNVLKPSEEELDIILRPYRIAKECGCKFYFGSDAHHPTGLAIAFDNFTRFSQLLDLHEENMFRPFGD